MGYTLLKRRASSVSKAFKVFILYFMVCILAIYSVQFIGLNHTVAPFLYFCVFLYLKKKFTGAMRIQKCWFCSASIYPGHGTTFVRNDCTVFRFCRPKCFKLFKKRLNPRKIKWTKISRKIASKELMNDPILQFERRVNMPAMYSQEILQQTIEAIPVITVERQRREDLFIANRVLAGQEKSKSRDLEFIDKHKHLLGRVDDDGLMKHKKAEREAEYN